MKANLIFYCFTILFVIITRCTVLHAQQITSSNVKLAGQNITSYGMHKTGEFYFLYGIIGTENQGGDPLIRKISSQGDVLWEKSYHSSSNILIRSACVNEEGGLTLAGNSKTGNNDDIIVLKTDNQGNIIWSRKYGLTVDERGFRIVMNDDGSYIVSGSTKNLQTELEEAFIMRINSNGQLTWNKILGGFDRDNAFDVSITDDSYIIFTGAQSSYGSGEYDFGFGKMDMNGNLIYFKTVGNSGQDHSRVIRQANNGYYILGHSASYSNGQYEVLLVKTNFNGEIIWSKRIFTNAELYTGDLTILPDGILISGTTLMYDDRDLFVLNTGFDGNIKWGKVFKINGIQEFPFGSSGTVLYTNPDQYTSSARSQLTGNSDWLLLSFSQQLNSNCFEVDFAPSIQSPILYSQDYTSMINQGSGFTESNISFTTINVTLEDELICTSNIIANFTADKQIVCKGDSVTFSNLSHNLPLEYFWMFENGNPSSSIEKDPVVTYPYSGIFNVSLRVENSSGSDEMIKESYIQVIDIPSLTLGADTAICKDDELEIVITGFETYLWHNGSTDNQMVISSPGWHSIDAYTSNGCHAWDSIFITMIATPELYLGPDTSFCDSEEILLSVSGFDSYIWHDGSTENQFLASTPGLHYVNAYTQEGCRVSDSIFIRFCCDYSIIIPNAFTPNGDNINDFFRPLITDITKYTMTIANRWGAVLFETDDYEANWDGSFKGTPCPEGVYFVVLKFDKCNDLGTTETETITCAVTLLR